MVGAGHVFLVDQRSAKPTKIFAPAPGLPPVAAPDGTKFLASAAVA